MSRIVTLFNNQKEAEKAVSALAESRLEEPEIHIIEDWPERSADLKLVPAPITGSGLSGATTSGPATASLTRLDDEEGYLKRSVQKGGVVAVVDLENDAQIPLAKGLLEELGGQLVIK